MHTTDTLFRQDEETLKRLPQLVIPYQLPDRRIAAGQLINTLIPFLAIWVAIYFLTDSYCWLTVPLFLVNGFFLGRLFILQHDCGHQSFTASRKANNIIGNILALLTSSTLPMFGFSVLIRSGFFTCSTSMKTPTNNGKTDGITSRQRLRAALFINCQRRSTGSPATSATITYTTTP